MMAEVEQVVELKDDFYKDQFGKIITITISLCVAIGLLIALIIYLYVSKPAPMYFPVDEDWRVQPTIPVDKPYISTPDLLQWVSEVIPKSFSLDFVNYNNQISDMSKYFTPDGYKVFLNQLSIYASYNNVQDNKQFISGSLEGAPTVINQGLLSGKYGWWVQVPVSIEYTGIKNVPSKDLTLQILIVRVPTLSNLVGVGIDNVIVSSGSAPTTSSGASQNQTQRNG